MQKVNSGQQCAILPSTGIEPGLYFILLKYLLLLAEAAWMHAGVCPLNTLVCYENLTGDARGISLARVFVHKAEEMQLRHSWHYSRSVVDLWADVICTSEDMPGPVWHWCSLCATFNFQWGHAGREVTVSLILPVFIWRLLNPGEHGILCVCVCVCACFYTFILVP